MNGVVLFFRISDQLVQFLCLALEILVTFFSLLASPKSFVLSMKKQNSYKTAQGVCGVTY